MLVEMMNMNLKKIHFEDQKMMIDHYFQDLLLLLLLLTFYDEKIDSKIQSKGSLRLKRRK
jgi:hypothetical protein